MQKINQLRKIVVTGANKGIGYEIVKGLYADENPYHVILGSRDITRGEEALSKIKKEVPASNNKIEFHQLDVNDSNSIDRFISWAKESLKEIDVLVNNAGYGYMKQSAEEGVENLKTNFFSVVELTEKTLPILAQDGKIIQISSFLGSLSFQTKQIQEKLSNPNLTREELMSLANELLEKTKELKHTSLEWNDQHYNNSKCLLNAYTRWVLPHMLKGDQQYYCCTPGYCRTDMTGPEAPLTAQQGSETPIFLVKLPFVKDPQYNGKFFEKKEPISY